MDMIMMEHGLAESNQVINWCKVFYASTLVQERNELKALELLESTTNQYVETLDGYQEHAYLESFYQQIGNLCFKLNKTDKAQAAFEKLVRCKEEQLGKDHKDLIPPLMQLQHLASVSAGTDKTYCLNQSQRAYDLICKIANEIDNNLIMNSGNHTAQEKSKLEQDLNLYNTYKLDVLFTLHNLHKINNDYVKALSFAKEHTQLNLQIYKREHKCYAYALMLEAQCMSMIPNLDHQKTLQVINDALKIQLKIGKSKHIDPFLSRIYEEKGHILRILGGDVT